MRPAGPLQAKRGWPGVRGAGRWPVQGDETAWRLAWRGIHGHGQLASSLSGRASTGPRFRLRGPGGLDDRVLRLEEAVGVDLLADRGESAVVALLVERHRVDVSLGEVEVPPP